MIKFDKNSLEDVRELATRMYIDQKRPYLVDIEGANVYFIIKAFCSLYNINIEYSLNRRSTEVTDDIN